MKEKTGGSIPASTRILKAIGIVFFIAGLAIGFMIILFGWPVSDQRMMSYGLSKTICLIEVTFSFAMVLLLFIFADILDCLRNIQQNTSEICAALEKEAKPED